MALTQTLRQPLPVESGKPRTRPERDTLAERAGQLSISVTSTEPFESHVRDAAEARRFVERDAEGVTWWLHMPGAGRGNTEVIWDPQRKKLSVGAWSRSVARRDGRSPGRLLWHSSLWQPTVDGAHATARLERGWVVVRLPYARSLRGIPAAQ